MKILFRITAALIVSAFIHIATASAEIYEYAAVDDFPVLDAGEVPFYADLGESRNVLAVNTANEDHRSRFARAEMTFAGTPGIYDITLTTLGELDGDCVYQLVVNGVVQGTVINTPVTVDYTVQQHQFENVSIPAGASIGVSAVAVSNGKIPEGSAYAFARGRWRTLTLVSDEAAGSQSGFADLELSMTASETRIVVNDPITYSLTAQNLASDTTATSPVISIDLPDILRFDASAECQLVQQEVLCALPELMPDGTATAAFSVTTMAAGYVTTVAGIDAAQTDLNILNNVAATTVTVNDDEPYTGSAKSGGSGSLSIWCLLLLFPAVCRVRMSNTKQDYCSG